MGRSPNIKKDERIGEIIAILRQQGNASFRYLADMLDISEITIRRDIAFMTSAEQYRFVQRVPGGIILLDHKMSLEYMFDLKLTINREMKEEIAKKALEFVHDGESLILDSGTTCLCVARGLHHRSGLRVVSTDVKIAEELGHYSNISSTILCGEIRPGYYSVGGELALEMLSKMHFEKAIMSVDAIDANNGVTNASMFEVGVKRRVAERSEQVIIVADSSKFCKVHMFHVFELNMPHSVVLITDRNISRECADQFRSRGFDLIVV